MNVGYEKSLVRIRKASRASVKVSTDSEVRDEHTIKVVHKKGGCETVLLSCPERLLTVHCNMTGRLALLVLL